MTRPEPSPRTPAEREADHAAIDRLSDGLLPALVGRLNATGLGELEVREGDWSVRLRRPPHASSPARRVARGIAHHPAFPHAEPRPAREGSADAARREPAEALSSDAPDRRSVATAPAVGVFRPGLSVGARVRAGDRIAVVDLLGIPQDVVAPIDGTLVELFAQAGEGVEYGEDVAAIEADAPAPAGER